MTQRLAIIIGAIMGVGLLATLAYYGAQWVGLIR
jgi:hypothetical protein